MLLLVNQSSCQASCFCNILICSYLCFSLFFIYIFSGAGLLSDIPVWYLLFPYLFLVVQLWYCFHLQPFFVTISISCVCSLSCFWALFFSVLFLLYYYGNFLMESLSIHTYFHFCTFYIVNTLFLISIFAFLFLFIFFVVSDISCFPGWKVVPFSLTLTYSVSSLSFLSINLLLLNLLLVQF